MQRKIQVIWAKRVSGGLEAMAGMDGMGLAQGVDDWRKERS
jgi:hypothetical protein